MISIVVQRTDVKGKPRATVVSVEVIISIDSAVEEAIDKVKKEDGKRGKVFHDYTTNIDPKYRSLNLKK